MQPPSLLRRLGALLIDWIVASLSAAALAGTHYPPKDIKENLVITAFFVVEMSVLTGLLGYSIGKRILGLKVENERKLKKLREALLAALANPDEAAPAPAVTPARKRRKVAAG